MHPRNSSLDLSSKIQKNSPRFGKIVFVSLRKCERKKEEKRQIKRQWKGKITSDGGTWFEACSSDSKFEESTRADVCVWNCARDTRQNLNARADDSTWSPKLVCAMAIPHRWWGGLLIRLFGRRGQLVGSQTESDTRIIHVSNGSEPTLWYHERLYHGEGEDCKIRAIPPGSGLRDISTLAKKIIAYCIMRWLWFFWGDIEEYLIARIRSTIFHFAQQFFDCWFDASCTIVFLEWERNLVWFFCLGIFNICKRDYNIIID